jgi:hypothetical protein
LNVPPSSRALVRRVRSLSAATLSPASPWPSSRPTSAPDHSRKSRRRCGYAWQARRPSRSLEHAFISLFRSSLRPRSLASVAHPGVTARSPALSACAASTGCVACWVPPTPANPRSRGRRTTLRLHVDRPGLPTRLVPCRGSASHVSCWIVHGHPPFRGFSPPVAARPSRASPSSMPFPTLRCRGSEEFSVALHLRLAASMSRVEPPSPCGADCSLGRTRSLRRRCSRRHKAAPLLVVPPFEDDLPASSHTSAGLLSWASIVRGSLRALLRGPSSRRARALFRVSENRKSDRCHPTSLRGVFVSASQPARG